MPPADAPREFDAVLFDLSGVLTTSPTPMMVRRVEEAGITMDDFLPIALGPLDIDTDHPWHRAERGEITMAEFVEEVTPQWVDLGAATLPEPPSADELLAEMSAVGEMVAAVQDARAAGYRTAIVTNMVIEWSAVWPRIVDGESLVDVVVDSAVVGLRKPNAAIFELALSRLGVSAERSLFLDDFAWNVVGAEMAGLHTMHVVDPVAAAAELRRRLGLPPA